MNYKQLSLLSAGAIYIIYRHYYDSNKTKDAHFQIASEPWDIGTGVKGYHWKAPKEKAVILLQHGWGDYAKRFVDQNNQLIPHLLEIGISVYAFDMRGSGDSPGNRGSTDAAQAVQDFNEARRQLKQQPLPIFLLGHSLGGLVAVTSLLDSQERVDGVVLLSPSLEHRTNPLARIIVHFFRNTKPTASIPVSTQSTKKLTAEKDSIEQLDQDTQLVSRNLPWISADSIITTSRENLARYHEIKVPVLLLHGTKDRSAKYKGSEDFIQAISSQDKTMHLVKRGRHLLLDDKKQDQILKAILLWLGDHIERES
ncbi:alpha/beta fold hydrolase [Macrococcus lamae]|uniref:Alpha/beta fold hydrolase n=1 Tax=Macrococcus lamae TaxID=198484 RepID=A0A4R6BTG5_9STAP|nr:alpha/beta fold hydrolase [Macrococcus lamae]TDM07934.1 alpha/beta fold hydrolase [Macrococcus lamae]